MFEDKSKMNSLPSVQNLTDAANANMQTFQSLVDIVLNATQRLTTINMEATRSAFAFASANSVPLFGDGVREQLASRVAAQGQGVEQLAAYLRNVNEVLLKTQADVAHLSAKRVSEANGAMNMFLDNLAKAGPAGTPDVVSALKSAVNAASAALESMIETTREVTETNLTAAANALQNTVTEAASSAKSSKKAA